MTEFRDLLSSAKEHAPPPPRDAFDRLVRRRDRRGRTRRLATAASLASLVVIAVVTWPTIQRTGPTRTYTVQELDRIVFPPAEILEPDDRFGEQSFDGALAVSALPVSPKTADELRLRDRGFVAARAEHFGHGHQRGAVFGALSWAGLFEDADHAVRAYQAILEDLRAKPSLEGETPLSGLGDAAIRLRGPCESEGGPKEEVCVAIVWRSGNVVLVATGLGRIEPREVQEIAERMDAAARRLGSENA